MRRLFWVGVGVAVGVSATRKVNQATQKATPAGVGTTMTTRGTPATLAGTAFMRTEDG